MLSNCPGARLWAHTWPDHLSDQIGLMVTVEQDHCTLIAVKRYWDTPCVGGRHNFFQRPLVTKNNKTHFSSANQSPRVFAGVQEDP